MGRKRKWGCLEAMATSGCGCLKKRHGSWHNVLPEEDEHDVATGRLVCGGDAVAGGNGGVMTSFQRRGSSAYEAQGNSIGVHPHELSGMKLTSEDKQRQSACAALQLHASQLPPAELNMLSKLEWRQPRSRYKYATMRRVRRRMRPIYKLMHDDASILDTHYAGQATCLLATLGDWEFNVFTMDKLTNGRPLFHAGLRMLQDHGLIEHFKLDVVKLMRCISLIEEGYHSSNPYHNAVHAVDVAQAMHCYLNQHKVSQYLTPLEKMIAIFSALAHDVEHPGVNNAFLIATSNHLASLYNNVSVLEYHHWRTAMSIFADSGIFQHLDKDTLESIEWQMKSLILATDITRQAEFLTKFKEALDQDDLNLKRSKDRHFMLQIALKVADISNPGRPWETSKRWSELVCDEFFKQGDYERKLGLPVTPLNDRYSTTTAKIQSGFMQFVVLPLFNEWRRFNPSDLSNKMIHNIKANKTEWDAIISQTEQAQQENAETPASQQDEDDTIPEESEDLDLNGPETETEVQTEVEEDEAEVVIRSEYVQLSKKQRCSVPHSSDGESGDERSAGDEEEEEDEEDEGREMEGYQDTANHDLIHIVSFMPRRHSLPVSSLLPDPSNNPPAAINTPFSILAQRRHSLPVSAIPNAGMDIFEQLSDQLESVAECSFNDQSEHAGDKISLSSLNPGALPDANREASKLTSAHGLDETRRSQPLSFVAMGEGGESTLLNTTDFAQAPLLSSPHQATVTSLKQLPQQLLLQQRAVLGAASAHRQKLRLAPLTSHSHSNKDCSTTISSPLSSNKVHGLLSTQQQHSVVIGRERAVSIPTQFRLKSALLELAESSLASRRVSMGDQPIYLDTTPLLSSPVSDDEYLCDSNN